MRLGAANPEHAARPAGAPHPSLPEGARHLCREAQSAATPIDPVAGSRRLTRKLIEPLRVPVSGGTAGRSKPPRGGRWESVPCAVRRREASTRLSPEPALVYRLTLVRCPKGERAAADLSYPCCEKLRP